MHNWVCLAHLLLNKWTENNIWSICIIILCHNQGTNLELKNSTVKYDFDIREKRSSIFWTNGPKYKGIVHISHSQIRIQHWDWSEGSLKKEKDTHKT